MQYFDTDDFEYEDEDTIGPGQHLAGLLMLIFVCAAILCMWIGMAVIPERSFSENENRSLAVLPEYYGLTLQESGGDFAEPALLPALKSGAFFDDLDSWITDQFPLRDAWMRVQFTTRSLMGQKEFSGVYIAEDGYLIGEPVQPDEEKIQKTVSSLAEFRNRYADLPMTMIVVPGAAGILTDKLPAKVQGFVRDEVQDVVELEEKITAAAGTEPGIRFADAASVLQEHEEEYIFYRTDHHWTSYGAYLVFQESTDELGISPVLEYRGYPVSDTFQGTLASKSGDLRSNDIVSVYEPQDSQVLYYVNYPATQTRRPSVYEPAALEEKDHYTVFFGGNHALVEIVTTAQTERNLLVFKDSFANCFIPFLIPYYDRIIMVDPRYYYDSIDVAMTEYGITDVLFLYSAEQLLQDSTLADTLGG